MTRTSPSVVDEKELIRQTRAGSMDALGQLFAIHGAQVYRMALRILGSPADAEDVLQDTFVGLALALRSFDDSRALAPWLARVTARIALTRLRSGNLRRRREETYALEDGSETSPSPSADVHDLNRALDALPLPLRTVLLLKEVDGYSHNEIAALLDIAPGTSAVRLHRAIHKLRDELERSK